MKKYLIAGVIAIVTIAAFTISPEQVKADAKVGEAAPTFSLADSTGKQHSLADFKGKTVVLEWINFKCPYVRKHYDTRNMQTLQEKYTKDGVVWLAINSSAPGKQGHLNAAEAEAALIEEGSKPTALLLDPDGTVGKAYGARTTPHMYIINPDGKLVYSGAIDDNSSSRHAAVKTSKNYVSAALENLKNGTAIVSASTEPYGCSVKYAS